MLWGDVAPLAPSATTVTYTTYPGVPSVLSTPGSMKSMAAAHNISYDFPLSAGQLEPTFTPMDITPRKTLTTLSTVITQQPRQDEDELYSDDSSENSSHQTD